jgi:hypothetical protein
MIVREVWDENGTVAFAELEGVRKSRSTLWTTFHWSAQGLEERQVTFKAIMLEELLATPEKQGTPRKCVDEIVSANCSFESVEPPHMVLRLSEIGIRIEQDGRRLSMNSFLELEWLLQYPSGLFQERSDLGFLLRVSLRFCLPGLLSHVVNR